MIKLTRLNQTPLVVNSDLIQFMEATPDTVITLVTGEKIVVAEPVEEIVERVVSFRRRAHPTGATHVFRTLTTLHEQQLESEEASDRPAAKPASR